MEYLNYLPLEIFIKDLTRPNGVAISNDQKTLYVAISDPKTGE